jgi:DNA-binding SARP family transcriptional activator
MAGVDGYGLRRLVTKDVKSAIVTSIGMGFNLTPVRIQLTGRLEVEFDHRVVDERSLYGRQARLIFALLVVERDRPVHRDELAEVLWSHRLPRTWEAALRGVVSKVRAFLSAAGLPQSATPSGGSGTYQLQLPPDVVVDIESAYSAVETAEQSLHEDDPARAIALAEYARKIASRPFLPDAKGRWVDSVRDRLGKVLLWALCVLSEGYAQRRRYPLAVRAAEDAIVLEPFRERTHQLLMRVHAAAGNPAEALRAYDRCRRLLAEELGVDPTAETSALHLALLQNGNE